MVVPRRNPCRIAAVNIMILRNIILIVCLSLFLIGYVGYWAYNTQYLAPRQELGAEITQLSAEIDQGRTSLATMTEFRTANQLFFYRSLPRVPNEAKSQYSFWLLELMQYSGFENNDVRDGTYTLVPLLGAEYRFRIQCTGTLSQLSNFLIEFYCAPFLHRIASMTLTPTDGNPEKLTFSMTVNALALDSRYNPYPPTNQLPEGYFMRLQSTDATAYNVIAGRNLLQTAKGGIDLADYTFMTGSVGFGDQEEVWFVVRTNDSTIKAKLGDTIHSGSFSGKIVEIHGQDVVLDRNGSRWLLTIGESLSEAFALPPETGEGRE